MRRAALGGRPFRLRGLERRHFGGNAARGFLSQVLLMQGGSKNAAIPGFESRPKKGFRAKAQRRRGAAAKLSSREGGSPSSPLVENQLRLGTRLGLSAPLRPCVEPTATPRGHRLARRAAKVYAKARRRKRASANVFDWVEAVPFTCGRLRASIREVEGPGFRAVRASALAFQLETSLIGTKGHGLSAPLRLRAETCASPRAQPPVGRSDELHAEARRARRDCG